MSEATISNGSRFGPDQPAHYCGKPGRSGPPKGNRNALRHGLRGTGKLPSKLAFIENAVNAFRRRLEDAVLKARGSISLSDAAAINTAVKWEKHGALCARWLTSEYEKLTPAERRQFSEDAARASELRDKAIDKLKLDAAPRPPWLQSDSPEGGDAC